MSFDYYKHSLVLYPIFKEIIEKVEKECNDLKGSSLIRTHEHGFKIEFSFFEVGYDPKKEMWEYHCERFGMQKEDYGKTVIVRGRECTIEKFNLRASKYPILVKLVDSHCYRKLSVEQCKKLLQERNDDMVNNI